MYYRVYFRINTPSYYKNKYGVGFENQEDRKIFSDAVMNTFINAGWIVKEKAYSGSCCTVIKDKQELYLHPQSFSGIVKDENITSIEQLISNNDLFKFEKTDIYDEVYDLSDREYLDILKSKRTNIENEILKTFTTIRRNLFVVDTWRPLQNVLGKFRLKRLLHYEGVYSSDNVDYIYIESVFNDLVNSKKITTANTKHGKGYRAA
jgi:hypothetical protein